MDLSFITNLSPTVQALISVIVPVLIATTKGIIVAFTLLKKLKKTQRILGSIAVGLISLLLQFGLVAFFIYMQWFELPSFVMVFFGGVAMKALIGVIGRIIGGICGIITPSVSFNPVTGGKRRRK